MGIYLLIQTENSLVQILPCIETMVITVTISNEFEPVYANNKPTSLEKVTDQVGRLGNTLFTLASMSIPEGPYMWPASVLNALRR